MRARAWTGSWTGASDNPSMLSAVSAVVRAIGAASAYGVRGRTFIIRRSWVRAPPAPPAPLAALLEGSVGVYGWMVRLRR